MTVQEFKEFIAVGIFSGQDIILNSTQNRLQAIAMYIPTYTQASLQEATAVNIPDPVTGIPINISLQSSNRPYRRIDAEVVGSYYIYTIFPTIEQELIQEAYTGSYQASVVLESVRPNEVVDRHVYSVVVDVIDTGVSSINKQVVDTAGQQGIKNLTSILADSATPAQIQDSNYTSAPWIFPRYEGSKITTTTNGGIEPVQAGAFFEGSSFSRETTDLSIQTQIGLNAVVYTSYFSSGKQETPDYILEEINLKLGTSPLPGDVNKSTATVSTYLTYDNTPTQIYAGDLLIFKTPTGAYLQEVTQVLPQPAGSSVSIAPYITFTQGPTSGGGTLGLTRNYYKNLPSSVTIAGESFIYRIQPTRLYNIVSTKLNLLPNRKILVRDTQKILFTDSYGSVYSSSLM